MKAFHKVLAAALCTGLSGGTLFAQSSSGTISGRLLDPSGQSIPGATVTLTRTDTREVRRLVTAPSGDIVFPSLQPGPYSITVEAPGFKTLEKAGMQLSASERLSVGNLVLQVGAQSETITVKAEIAPVQTASSEHGAVIDYNQVAQLPTRGRDIFGLFATLPGVVYDGRGGDGIGVGGSPQAVSGARGIYSAANIDGISGNTRSGSQIDTTVSMDTVAEVKVLLNNYQAEYGKGAAGIINIVTKGGTQDFHGSAYYYARNEKLNANDFFENTAGHERGRYRYNTMGATWGGPLYLGGLNKNKDKLFFFLGFEYRPSTVPQDTRYYTVPTLAERNGDFSHTVADAKGGLFFSNPKNVFLDPLTGKPFSNGIVPADRIDRNMQKILNLFPLPNAPDQINGGALSPSGNWYNYSITQSQERPGWTGSVRLDYNISDKLHALLRASNYGTHNRGANSTVNRLTWDSTCADQCDYALASKNWGGTLTWIASPSLVGEFVVGYAAWKEDQPYPDSWLAQYEKDKLGINLPQLYPAQNPLNLIPRVSFGSQNIGPNAAVTGWEGRFPMNNISYAWTATASLTKLWNSHQFKVGVQGEYVHYLFDHGGPSDVWSGNFNFQNDTQNTLTNTSIPYANALLGYYSSYTESTNRTQYSPVTPILEFYAQDTWKASRRLTLDLGVRFTVGLQQYQGSPSTVQPGRYQASAFLSSMYDPAKAPLLYRPALNGSTRVAVDPRNPTVFLPSALIGYVIPGTGDPLNGVVLSGDPSYPRALVDSQGILPAPRVGFAWDVFGDGSTAVRGGFGMNYNPRNGSGVIGDLQSNPPNTYSPVTRYGTTATYLNAQGTYTPPGWARTLDRNNSPAVLYNTSLDIQRRLPLNFVLDVGYVGTFGRHIGTTTQLNNVPFGTRFLASSLDPTQSKPQALGDDFLRQYRGYGGIPYVSFNSNSNYHGLQTSLQRRFSNGFQLGAVYAWSKAMDYSNDDKGDVGTYLDKSWFYGLSSYDRTHVLAVNYLWNLPGDKIKNGFLRNVLGGWQISGITRWQSGSPLSLTANLKTGCTTGYPCFTSTNNFGTDIMGGGGGVDTWRAVQKGNPTLPKNQQTVDRWFDTSVFSPPALAGQVSDMAGVQRVLATMNVGRRILRGPGINNTDLALFKNFKVAGSLQAQFRAEAYNVFNHTQFDNPSTGTNNPMTAVWDQSGVQTNPSFGHLDNARDARIIQLAIQVKF